MRCESTARIPGGGQAGGNGQGLEMGRREQTGGSDTSAASGSTTSYTSILGAGGSGGNGAADVQRMLSRLPDSTLADLQKGDAVMIVSTAGGNSGPVTAITLLAGVEPILTAAPNRSASSLLSPWSLGATGGGEGDAAQ